MRLVTDDLGDGGVPVLDIAAEPTVQVWQPRLGWVRQHSKRVPLLDVSYGGLAQWLRYRLRRLERRGGTIVMMHRHITHPWAEVGLFHDRLVAAYQGGPFIDHRMGGAPADVIERMKLVERVVREFL